MSFIAACAAYPIEYLGNWAAYERKLGAWVAEAADQQAELLVFPEYGAMELASLFNSEGQFDLQQQIDAVSGLVAEVDALHDCLAREHQLTILAASMPVRLDDGRAVNRARLFGPEGMIGFQDKLMMTRFEREVWSVSAGTALNVFDTPVGCVGIAICYDAEFPVLCRQMVELGAEILLVPSCTDALAGYHRVRTGAMARALENQCYVLHAPTVGTADWSEAVDVNVGAAAVYAPADLGFPSDGIVVSGEIDVSGWVFAEIDLDKVAAVRVRGQVLNHCHWDEQLRDLS